MVRHLYYMTFDLFGVGLDENRIDPLLVSKRRIVCDVSFVYLFFYYYYNKLIAIIIAVNQNVDGKIGRERNETELICYDESKKCKDGSSGWTNVGGKWVSYG
jgi:hypothetical protein